MIEWKLRVYTSGRPEVCRLEAAMSLRRMFLQAWLLTLAFASVLCAAETTPVEQLLSALQKSDASAVKRLIERGIDPSARDANGTPFLMVAVLYATGCVNATPSGRTDSAGFSRGLPARNFRVA